ncbi:MAG: hypothetical protein ACREPI_00860 [Candidatus Dormibacterales bacterium]
MKRPRHAFVAVRDGREIQVFLESLERAEIRLRAHRPGLLERLHVILCGIPRR